MRLVPQENHPARYGVTLPDGRDVGGYSLRKYADEREKTDWRGEEGIRVTLDDGFPARLQRSWKPKWHARSRTPSLRCKG